MPQGKYNAEIIKQAEAGVKYSSGPVTATFAGLYTKLNNRRQVLFVNDGQGGFTERVNLVATEIIRGRGDAELADTCDNLHFNGNITCRITNIRSSNRS